MNLKAIMCNAEKDIETISRTSLTEETKQLVIDTMKRKAINDFVKEFENIHQSSISTSEIYDYIKVNLCDIQVNIQRTVVADTKISMKKHNSSSDKRNKDIISLFLNENAIWDNTRNVPLKLLKISDIARMLGLNYSYTSSLLTPLRKKGYLENMPHYGWYLVNYE